MERKIRNLAAAVGLAALGIIIIESIVSAGCYLFLALFSPETLATL